MNYSLDLARQIADDRRVRFTDKARSFPSSRSERRRIRAAARRGLDITDRDDGR